MKNRMMLLLIIAHFSLFSVAKNALTEFLTYKEKNLGTMRYPQKIRVVNFHYCNKTNKPVVIKEVRTSCGCTRVDFSHKPVMPQKSGDIKVTVNLSGKTGHFNKSILVYTNAYEPTLLKIKDNITN